MSMSAIATPPLGLLAMLRAKALPYAALFCIVFGLTMHWNGFHRSIADAQEDLYGHDYISFYAAGRLALEGKPALAYDSAAHQAREGEINAAERGKSHESYYYFGYPPTYLTIVTPFAALGYYASLVAWLGATMAFAGFALARVTGERGAALAAVATPAAIVVTVFGQNALLSTGLIGLALALLPTRQVLAGVAIGLLSFKPQLGLVFPLILIVGGYWRAFAAAAATVLASVVLSVLLFGVETWQAFLAQAGASREKLLENSAVGFEKIQSLFAALRFYDVPVSVAYAGQGMLAVAVVASVVILWRRPGIPYELKAAAAAVATLLMTPFCLAYDLTIELVAISFLFRLARRTGWLAGEIPALCLIALAPAVTAMVPAGPWFLTGLASTIGLYALILRRAHAPSRPEGRQG